MIELTGTGSPHVLRIAHSGSGKTSHYRALPGKLFQGSRLHSRMPPAGLPRAASHLARQEHPDTSAYNDPEIVWRLTDKEHHVGMIVKSPDPKRVEELMWNYAQRFRQDFFASAPPREKPTD